MRKNTIIWLGLCIILNACGDRKDPSASSPGISAGVHQLQNVVKLSEQEAFAQMRAYAATMQAAPKGLSYRLKYLFQTQIDHLTCSIEQIFERTIVEKKAQQYYEYEKVLSGKVLTPECTHIGLAPPKETLRKYDFKPGLNYKDFFESLKQRGELSYLRGEKEKRVYFVAIVERPDGSIESLLINPSQSLAANPIEAIFKRANGQRSSSFKYAIKILPSVEHIVWDHLD